MPHAIQGILAVLGRLTIVAIFLLSAAHDIMEFNGTVAFMKSNNVPYPELLLPGAIVFLIAGGVSILIGFKARFGALLLLIFLALAAYYFHDFWDKATPQEQQEQMIHFMKNLSMMGAMLFIMAVGAGPWSLDAKRSETTL